MDKQRKYLVLYRLNVSDTASSIIDFTQFTFIW